MFWWTGKRRFECPLQSLRIYSRVWLGVRLFQREKASLRDYPNSPWFRVHSGRIYTSFEKALFCQMKWNVVNNNPLAVNAAPIYKITRGRR